MTNLTTERANPESAKIDQMTSFEAVRVINREDAKVAAAVRRALPEIAEAVEVIAEAIAGGGRLFYVGAGTSGRLGILDAVECVPTFSVSPALVQSLIAGGEPAVTRSIEGAEDRPELARRDLAKRGLAKADVVCGIAASGRTPYVIGGLEYAKSLGAKTIAIACNMDAPIGAQADISIGVDVGPEVIAGSTRMKAGTAQKMILNMLSSGAMIRLGKVYGNLMVDVKVSNQKLAERACRLVMRLTGADAEHARELLARANNEVKAAVVMARIGVEYEEASQMLISADGKLRAIIGNVTD
ncbi:MAG: N-acetylmuramic acid 6-phosphate etherase [Chloroflexota bacterium]|nr:N-acetylmuramic acid 6-phosphate etherase [Chloroflexota bacterium]